MKKIILIIMIFCICACKKDNAVDAVKRFLDEYKNLSQEILNSIETEVNEMNLSDEQKELYRSILKEQYKNIKYEIDKEKYDGKTSYIRVLITVRDLYKVNEESTKFIIENRDEFLNNGELDENLVMGYRLEKMMAADELVTYEITFEVEKNDKSFEVINVSEDTLKKIHGIYN